MEASTMKLVIASRSRKVSGDWFPDEGAARDAARRVQQRVGTALGR
jgi:hypothetical protein